MAIIRSAITAAVAALCESSDAQEVEIMPRSDPGAFPALHIFDGGESPREAEAGTDRMEMDITVEGYVERGAGQDPYDDLNALHAWLVDAMAAEPPLGTTPAGPIAAVEIVERGGLRISVAELANQARLGFAQDFTITYSVVRGGMSQQI
ncbi:hypothetical protein ABC347_10925 [Sphingomonas sp. 1P06PA]|uniref:hypothetical protein n=1 Tax=Sphingomonas sp. 1P06PA TaxID=554121 RepID=UPI0039A4074F